MEQGTSNLDDKIQTLNTSLKQADEKNSNIEKALDQFENGMNEYLNGVKMMNEKALQKLSKEGGEAGEKLVHKVQTLKEAENVYDSFMGGKAGEVTFEIETAKIS